MISEKNNPSEHKRLLDEFTENIKNLKISPMKKGIMKFQSHVFIYVTGKFEFTIEHIIKSTPEEIIIEEIKQIWVQNLKELDPLYILMLKVDLPNYVIIFFKSEPFTEDQIKTIWFTHFLSHLTEKLIENKDKEEVRKRLEFYESLLKTLEYLDLIDILDKLD